MAVPPTIKDVAAKSGVSFKTVSRVINKEDHVSPVTRDRVMSAIAELGYVTNHGARGLRNGRTHTLRLLMYKHAGRFLTNPFQDEVIAGVVDRATAHGFAILLELVAGHSAQAAVPTVTRRTDGTIFLDSNEAFSPGGDALWPGEPAVVLANRDLDARFGWIDADFFGGAHRLTEHLIDLGHRDIVHLTDNPSLRSSQLRRAGYETALAGAGIAPSAGSVLMTDGMRESGYAAVELILREMTPCTAILAVNDLTALGAIDCLRRHGLTIPGDVSVTGYDDIAMARYLSPPLTTVHVPWYEMGALAVDQIIGAIIRSEPIARDIFPVDLRLRGTTAPPGARALTS